MVLIEEYEFTYQDYLNYCDSFCCNETEEEYFCISEPETEYIYNEDENAGDKKHDKIFKDILQSKEEMSNLLKFFVKYEITAEELELYNANYITKNFKYKQADIVYKIKGEQIYFLVEHQTKVDYSMAYRMLNYCVEIMRCVVDGEQINRSSFKYPRIIPIVLYTGSKKWTASNSFAEIQTEDKNYEIEKIDAKYKLIDINECEIEALIKEKTMLTNTMVLEKSKSLEDIFNNLTMIVKNIPKVQSLEGLKRIVLYLYENINEEEKTKIVKIIEEGGGEENMLTARRIIDAELNKRRKEGWNQGIAEGRAEGIAQGIAQGIAKNVKQIITQMVKMNFENDIIKQVTGTKDIEIEKIRKEIQQQ